MIEQRSLPELFIDLPVEVLTPVGNAVITQVVSDSRQVVPGCLFVAVRGSIFDGHHFIPDAVRLGAAAVVGEDPDIHPGVPYVQVNNTRHALPYLAAAFYGNPGRKLTMIGVTGTDGKTTTTNLIYHILNSAGLRVGMVSTVNAVIGDQVLDTGFHVTTPEAVDVQHYLALMVEAGLTHAVLETTSHGWAQHRVDGCEFDVAVVTNITHEHLDEHGSLENYRQAKARLFRSLTETKKKLHGNPRAAILNQDDSSFETLRQICVGLNDVRVFSYGMQTDADVSADQVLFSPQGVSFEAVYNGDNTTITSRLVGGFNVSNILAAFTATVCGLGLDPLTAKVGIAMMSGIPGRMEAIHMGQRYLAIVDFAHTPNALRRALETARGLTRGKVIAVFGSAGLRDQQKRRMMAETAAELADFTILTAEDPRTESLTDILIEMAEGAQTRRGIENVSFWRVPDRGDAIRKALSLAKPGDVVLICGKGHEQSMCFGRVEYAWDDRIATRAALAECLGVSGPEMPYLPTQHVPGSDESIS